MFFSKPESKNQNRSTRRPDHLGQLLPKSMGFACWETTRGADVRVGPIIVPAGRDMVIRTVTPLELLADQVKAIGNIAETFANLQSTNMPHETRQQLAALAVRIQAAFEDEPGLQLNGGGASDGVSFGAAAY